MKLTIYPNAIYTILCGKKFHNPYSPTTAIPPAKMHVRSPGVSHMPGSLLEAELRFGRYLSNSDWNE